MPELGFIAVILPAKSGAVRTSENAHPLGTSVNTLYWLSLTLDGVVDSGVASAKLMSSSRNYCPAPLPCKVLVSYHPPTLLRPSASIGAFDAYRSSC